MLRTPRPPLTFLAIITLSFAVLLSCEEATSPASDETPTPATATSGADDETRPRVQVTRPIDDHSSADVAGVPPGFRVQWEDLALPDAPIVGYQLKLIDGGSPIEPDEQVIRYLLHTMADGTSALRRPNLLIPDGLAVDEPELGEPWPPLPSNDHFFDTDWWPHLDDLYTDREIVITDLETGFVAYALAIRAVDAEGRVTPVEGFSVADIDAPGNVVRAWPQEALAGGPRLRLTIDDNEVVVGPNPDAWRIEVPETLGPFSITWEVDADWYGYDGGPSRFRADGSDWSEWGAPVPIDVDVAGRGGEKIDVEIQGRDERDDEEFQTGWRLTLSVVGVPFDRTALLIDDFHAAGVDDCEHDAIVGGFVEYAVAPHLENGEELDRFDTHPPSGECSESSAVIEVDLSTLSHYRTVFWNVKASDDGSALGAATDRFAESNLGIYVRAGGNLIVWGRDTIAELLGGFYPDEAYLPDLPIFPHPNFGEGSFVYDVMRVRVALERAPRGVAGTVSSACSGIVGLEATDTAIAMGLPAGILDPTGFDPERRAIWFSDWAGYHNVRGRPVNAPNGTPPLADPLIEPLYQVIPNAWAWSDEPETPCGTSFGSPIDAQPVILRIETPGAGGRIVWIGTELWPFAQRQPDDVNALMRGIANWIYDG